MTPPARALFPVYIRCASRAGRALYISWPIIPASAAAWFLYRIIASIFAPMGFAGGMLVGLCELLLFTMYYSWIHDAVDGSRLNWKDLVEIDYSLFSTILSVAFIFFLAQFLVGQTIQGLGVNYILLLLQLVIVFVFNAIPEVIYINRSESLHALSQASVFTRENWIEWYLPLLVLLSPLLLLDSTTVLVLFSQTNPLLPGVTIVQATALSLPIGSASPLLSVICGMVLANWFMLFRGFLFKALEAGAHKGRNFRF